MLKPPLPSSCVNTIMTCLLCAEMFVKQLERTEKITFQCFHLPLQWRHRINSLQFSSCGYNIITLLTVTFHVNPFILVPIFNHYNQTGPALSRGIDIITSSSSGLIITTNVPLSNSKQSYPLFLHDVVLWLTLS